MTAEQLIQSTIAKRQAAGLSLRAYGAEGFTLERPYTCHANSDAQRNRWVEELQAKGFTVEAIL